MFEAAMTAVMIKAIPDDEFIRDGKTDPIGFDGAPARALLLQKDADPDLSGPQRAQTLRQLIQGETRIENVVDDQDPAALQ